MEDRLFQDPSDPIISWKIPRKTDVDDAKTELANWKKNIKPSKSDFKEFHDEVFWTRAKETIMMTLEAQGLEHLVDPKFVPTNPDLDKTQQKWLYKVFQDIMKASTAKTITTKYLDTKDTRALWKELCEHLNNSMTSEIQGQQISNYLTSTRYHLSNW